MAWLTNGLQIVIVIGAAFELRHLVINLLCFSDSPLLKAWLAETVVSLQDAYAGLVPIAAIATLMAASSALVCELADLAIGLMSGAIT